MESLNGNGRLRLIGEWESSDMEEDGCCGSCSYCCSKQDARLHRSNTLIRRQKGTRIPFFAVALLLLLAALVLLLTIMLVKRGDRSPDSKTLQQPDSHSSGVNLKQLPQSQDSKNPSAMLTAPSNSNFNGTYLEWETALGNAHCDGGFTYSSGNLVVPRKGIYRVFLQITYENNSHPDCRGELRLFNRVFVIKDEYNKDVLLLSSFDTVSCSMEHWSKSLYTAGLFSLEANSRLRVTSSHPELIINKQDLVFFGAELLPC